MFFVILEFNTAYTCFLFIKWGIRIISLVALFLLIVFSLRRFKVDFMVLGLIIGALPLLFNLADGHIWDYIRLYILFLPMAVLYLTTLFKEGRDKVCSLLLKYSNIVIVLSLVSLFFWSLGTVSEMIPYTMLVPNNWGGNERFIPTYYGIYFETQEAMAIAGQESASVRNTGIFNEAPMHNMILCVAIAIEVFLRPKLSKVRILILVITVLSTISTTGIVFLTLLLSAKLYSAMRASRRIVLILGLPLFLLLMLFSVSATLENKKETGEGSYNSRSRDIVRCIEVGVENPLLGKEMFHDNKPIKSENYGFSNSTFTIFAHGGFYVLSFYLMALLIMPFLCYRRTKDTGILGVMLFYFLLFTFTLSPYKYLTMIFMAIGLAYWNVVFYKKAKHLAVAAI